MRKPRVAFVPADQNNLKFVEQLQNSLRKFHNEEELPLIRFDNPNPQDKNFWYRAKPIIAKQLLEEYETVIGLDADQIILGDISHIWNIDADVGTVLNDFNYPLDIWDIGPRFNTPYFNNGLVVLKNKDFVNHWLSIQ